MHKIIHNAVYGKMIETRRNKIYVKVVSNKKHCLKWTSKPSYMSQKIFDNNLVAILKNSICQLMLLCVFWY